MIFIPTSKLVVDCFTHDKNAYELFAIDYASKFIPDWWKHAPKDVESNGFIPVPTIKRCVGIHDLYKSGIMLPLWSDLAIKFENNRWDFQFSNGYSGIISHSADEWKYYADPDKYISIKLMSPWVMYTKNAINWTYMKPLWNFSPDSPMNILSGVLNFKYQHGTNVNILYANNPVKEIIPAGQPVVHFIPHSEKEIVLKHHHVSEEDFRQKFQTTANHSFVRGYQRAMRIKQEKKCPFHL